MICIVSRYRQRQQPAALTGNAANLLVFYRVNILTRYDLL